MTTIDSVHFDNFIPNWSTQSEKVDFHIMILVVEGKVSYDIHGEEVTADRGDFMYIPRTTRRAGRNHASGPHQKYTVLFHGAEMIAAGIPFLERRQFVKFNLRNFQYAHRRFERLFEEFRNGGNYRSLICLGILQETVGLLAREMERPEVTPMKMKYAQTIKTYLLEHYREQIEIDQLARLIRRSPNYAISVFREVLGCSPIKYMHQLRMLEACSLLLTADMTVSSISSYLGYYDTSYFFRMFKKYTGMSPTEFTTHGRQIDRLQLF